MRIVLAVDGSPTTKKTLEFIAAHEALSGADVVAVNVQHAMPPRVRSMVGSAAIADYHREEADKVLEPVRRFLEKKGIACKTDWKAGEPASTIVAAATRAKADMIVMGTHGYGALGRAVMGSVAQRVLHDTTIPVLLVK